MWKRAFFDLWRPLHTSDPKMNPKSSSSRDPKVTPKWCQSARNVTPKWCQSDSQEMAKWQTDPKVTQTLPNWPNLDDDDAPSWCSMMMHRDTASCIVIMHLDDGWSRESARNRSVIGLQSCRSVQMNPLAWKSNFAELLTWKSMENKENKGFPN